MEDFQIEETPVDETILKKYYKKSSWRLSAMWVALIVFDIAFSIIHYILYNASEFVRNNPLFVSVSASLLMYGVLYITLNLVMKNNEKSIPERKKMSFGNWVLILIGSYCINILFNYIGTYTNYSILKPFGYTLNSVNESYEILERFQTIPAFLMEFIYVGLIGPVMEELIFRKTIIDNFAKYGVGAAILVSALNFGLVHGNFSQFFMTFAFGIVLGFVYSYTGNVKYTIAMHCTLNLYNATLGYLVQYLYDEEFFDEINNILLKFENSGDMDAAYNMLLNFLEQDPGKTFSNITVVVINYFMEFMILVSVFVFLFCIKKLVRFLKSVKPGVKGSKTYATLNIGMIACYVLALFGFAEFYINRILESPYVTEVLKNISN